MTKEQKSVAETLQKPTRRTPWIIGGVAALVIAASAATFGPALASQLAPAPAPTATVAAVDTVTTLTSSELDSIQQAADDQQAQIAADAKAAAAAAAAQAAADAAAAAKSTHHSSSAGGPVRCPAGSFANSNDGTNDTSCFPDVCSHIAIPDPAHPECDSAFKP